MYDYDSEQERALQVREGQQKGTSKKPLEWRLFDRVKSGKVTAEINYAAGFYETVYSIRLNREGGNTPQTRFFRPEDLENAVRVLKRAQDLIRDDQRKQGVEGERYESNG